MNRPLPALLRRALAAWNESARRRRAHRLLDRAEVYALSQPSLAEDLRAAADAVLQRADLADQTPRYPASAASLPTASDGPRSTARPFCSTSARSLCASTLR